MMEQGLEVIVYGFRSYQICLLGIGLIRYFSIEDFRTDPDIKTVDSKLQNSIIQNSYRFGTLLTISGIISFVATAGLSFSGKFGRYAAVSLVLIQIVAITGSLDRERVTHFSLLPEITKQLTLEEIEEIETVFVPIIINSVFAMLVANIVTVTVLILPRVLTIFNMCPDILPFRIGRSLQGRQVKRM